LKIETEQTACSHGKIVCLSEFSFQWRSHAGHKKMSFKASAQRPFFRIRDLLRFTVDKKDEVTGRNPLLADRPFRNFFRSKNKSVRSGSANGLKEAI